MDLVMVAHALGSLSPTTRAVLGQTLIEVISQTRNPQTLARLGKDLTALARRFHSDLPDRIRQYLNGRGIPDEMIDLNFIGWNGWRITIPIFNREGKIEFFKQAKDP